MSAPDWQISPDFQTAETYPDVEAETEPDNSLFTQIITELEKHSTGAKYCFEAGCVEEGSDGTDTILDRVLMELEKQ